MYCLLVGKSQSTGYKQYTVTVKGHISVISGESVEITSI